MNGKKHLDSKMKQNTCYERLPCQIHPPVQWRKVMLLVELVNCPHFFVPVFLWHRTVWPGNTPNTQLQFSIPIIATGLRWFTAGQAPAPRDNAHDYICTNSMGPMEGRGRTPGQQHAIPGFVWIMDKNAFRMGGCMIMRSAQSAWGAS